MKKIKILFLIICVIVFAISAYNIVNYLLQENSNKKINNELIEKGVVKIQNDIVKNKQNVLEEKDNNAPISVNFSVLQQENKDIIGWLYLENTPINLPVVQSNDNQYYLRKDINKKYNIAGTIFMDYRNNSQMTDDNTIIYGHNMKNGTMFATIVQYRKQEFYNQHKEMYFFTPQNKYKVEIFTGFTVSEDSNIYKLHEIDYKKKKEFIEKSDFKSEVIVNNEDKILTLSTCAYDYDGARYIVMGVLNEIN